VKDCEVGPLVSVWWSALCYERDKGEEMTWVEIRSELIYED